MTTEKMATRPLKPWTAAPRKRYRLVDAKLVDPKDGSVHENVTIDIKDGVIHRMTKLSSRPSPGDEVLSWTHNEPVDIVNLEGRYIVPGLIDCHVHLATPPGEDGLKDTMNQDPNTALLRQPYLAYEMLKRGFTSIRDCGGAGLAMKEALAEGLHPGPRLFISGHGISQTGGHGDMRSSKDEEYQCCGGNTRGLGRIADGVASDSQTFVTAHAYTPAAIQNAVANGVLGVEHGNLIDEPTAKLLAEKGGFLTPTLITYETMASREFGNFLPPSIAAKNAKVLEAGLASIQLADRCGVTMCFGTDLLGPLQVAQSGEFKLRKQAGLSPLKILQSATVNAARMLRQEDKLGRVKEGFAADLLILNANPLEDIEILARPEKHLLAVIKDGKVLSSRWSKLRLDVDQTALIE
ncbi:hypothetical protein HII31_04612 [Pseudocercospora fuligena]|uniref:Amidohydrolase-related domain-containing protein n=1 Tax=Pseudocercospora fuligena TaxID=685502 RepID=A0A8H6RPW2_9PEZI|nr:hypothetical protein HII31_04612 [Pseudocercospora fuligena]